MIGGGKGGGGGTHEQTVCIATRACTSLSLEGGCAPFSVCTLRRRRTSVTSTQVKVINRGKEKNCIERMCEWENDLTM